MVPQIYNKNANAREFNYDGVVCVDLDKDVH